MRPMSSRRRSVALVVALTAALAVVWLGRPFLNGLSFVVRMADMRGIIRTVAEFDTGSISERMVDLPLSRQGAGLTGRLYTPNGRSRRSVLLVSGLHPSGIDEERLVMLARQLAASGLSVLTPDIRELAQFNITPGVTDQIESAALWLSDLVRSADAAGRDGNVGLMGISFSGGLSIVAAGRPALRDRVAFVFSLGGHDDLPRVLRYLCTGIEPLPANQLRLGPTARTNAHARDEIRPPHDYGAAVMLLGIVDRLVPPQQVDGLRDAVRRFLLASTLDRTDKAKSRQEFAAVRSLKLPEPAATLLRYVNERDTIHLGVRLLPYIEQYGGAPALSPSKSQVPSAPVFLLHGRDDNVIPATESEYLAADLQGRAPRVLVSDLISHADLKRSPRSSEVVELASFWGDMLAR